MTDTLKAEQLAAHLDAHDANTELMIAGKVSLETWRARAYEIAADVARDGLGAELDAELLRRTQSRRDRSRHFRVVGDEHSRAEAEQEDVWDNKRKYG